MKKLIKIALAAALILSVAASGVSAAVPVSKPAETAYAVNQSFDGTDTALTSVYPASTSSAGVTEVSGNKVLNVATESTASARIGAYTTLDFTQIPSSYTLEFDVYAVNASAPLLVGFKNTELNAAVPAYGLRIYAKAFNQALEHTSGGVFKGEPAKNKWFTVTLNVDESKWGTYSGSSAGNGNSAGGMFTLTVREKGSADVYSSGSIITGGNGNYNARSTAVQYATLTQKADDANGNLWFGVLNDGTTNEGCVATLADGTANDKYAASYQIDNVKLSYTKTEAETYESKGVLFYQDYENVSTNSNLSTAKNATSVVSSEENGNKYLSVTAVTGSGVQVFSLGGYSIETLNTTDYAITFDICKKADGAGLRLDVISIDDTNDEFFIIPSVTLTEDVWYTYKIMADKTAWDAENGQQNKNIRVVRKLCGGDTWEAVTQNTSSASATKATYYRGAGSGMVSTGVNYKSGVIFGGSQWNMPSTATLANTNLLIDNIIISDGTSMSATKLENDGATITAELSFDASYAESATPVLALYDDSGALIDVDFKNVPAEKGEGSCTLSLPSAEYDAAKILIWDSLEKGTPLRADVWDITSALAE